jgi:8-oxo-dGTP pyrophosphatase MutT (NUDIX family)
VTQVIDSKLLYSAGRGHKFLSTYELTVRKAEMERPYFMVSRGTQEKLPSIEQKRPDAVIVVGTINSENGRQLVLVDQFRPAIGGREISFPAGLIEPYDWQAGNGLAEPTAAIAAKREFFEEVGLLLKVRAFSPANLYSSAGMTNESSIVVFGEASGKPSIVNNEPTEDIHVLLWGENEIQDAILNPKSEQHFSKISWPMLYMFSKMGLA